MSYHTKAQVAAIINTNEPKIQVRQKMQFQKGGSDCGLFVITYAVDLCQQIEPADVRYQQESMRSHLLQCLTNNCLTPFPSKKLKRGKPASDVIYMFVHVVCLSSLKKWLSASLAKNGTQVLSENP